LGNKWDKGEEDMVHFLSILGTSLYEPVIYTEKMDEQTGNLEENEYVQFAIMERFRDSLKEDGKITIFLTEKSKANNWENRVYQKEEKNASLRWTSDQKTKVIAGNKKVGMKEQLGKRFPELSDRTETVDIANAMTEEQIWQVFGQIYDSIGENEEIIFDITHSFRSIPMLAITIISYAKIMKNCKLRGIYYGSFEASEERDGKKVAPIVDLTVYNEILEWTNAADAFMNYGIVRPMRNLYSEKMAVMTDAERRDRDWENIGSLINRMEQLYRGLTTGRGLSIKTESKSGKKKGDSKRSIKEAYKQMQDEKKKVEAAYVKEQKPMHHLLAKAGESFEQYWGNKDAEELKDYQIGCGVIKWSIENTMTQQGYTALEETIKTFLCHKFCIEGNTEISRDGLVGFVLNSMSFCAKEIDDFKNADRKIVFEHMLEKNDIFRSCYDKWNEKVQKRAEVIIAKVPIDNMVDICRAAKEKRNDINHFGFRKDCGASDKLINDLENYYKKFREGMEEWGEEPLDLPMLTEKEMKE
jgi:CRISPR-associated Csx2 family protein